MRPVFVSVGLALAVFGSMAVGQADKKEPQKIFVPLDGGCILQATTKKNITEVHTDKEGIVDVFPEASGGEAPMRFFEIGENPTYRITVSDGIAAGGLDPRTITLYGRGLGTTTLKVVDSDKHTDTFQVVVYRQLNLAAGMPCRLQHPSKQAIEKFQVDAEKTVRVTPVANDKTTIQLDPLLAGDTTLRLTDAAGKSETWQVQVRVADQTLSVGDKHKLQLGKKQILGRVVVESLRVLDVEAVENDPTAITIVAKGPGIAQVILVDRAEKQEKLQIAVKPKQ